jgi:hypothetical protein
MKDFNSLLALPAPIPEWNVALQALWWDARGDWERAHALAQTDEADPRSAWVHAYLHRKEGDLSNAAYWYRRAGHPVATGSLEKEMHEIAAILLSDSARALHD